MSSTGGRPRRPENTDCRSSPATNICCRRSSASSGGHQASAKSCASSTTRRRTSASRACEHQARQLDVPPLLVRAVGHVDPDGHAERVEGLDRDAPGDLVGQRVHRGAQPARSGRASSRRTAPRCPSGGPATSLLEGEPGLAGAGSAGDVEPRVAAGQLAGSAYCSSVRRCTCSSRACATPSSSACGSAAPADQVGELGHLLDCRARLVADALVERVPDAVRGVVEVALARSPTSGEGPATAARGRNRCRGTRRGCSKRSGPCVQPRSRT